MNRMKIIGTGSALPNRVVSTEEVSRLVGIPAGRVDKLFGVETRNWSRDTNGAFPVDGESCSQLSAAAARSVLRTAKLKPEAIDALVCVSTSPDSVLPPLDWLVTRDLGLQTARSVSLHSACTGIIRALSVAQGWLALPGIETVLITTAECLSPFYQLCPEAPLDHRLSATLFGDGSAALIVGTGDSGPLYSNGLTLKTGVVDEEPGITCPGFMSSNPPARDSNAYDFVGYHDFKRVLDHGVGLTVRALDDALANAGMQRESIQKFLTHQASGRIIENVRDAGLPYERYPSNANRIGNTVSASMGILLDEQLRAGDIHSGSHVAMHTAESATWSYGGVIFQI